MKLNEKKCSEFNCDYSAYTKGLCDRHYHYKKYNDKRRRIVRQQQRSWIRNGDANNDDTKHSGGITVSLSHLQLMWLYSRGGRSVQDVLVENGEYFVVMRNQRKNVPVIIPSDIGILSEYHVVVGSDKLEVLRYKRTSS